MILSTKKNNFTVSIIIFFSSLSCNESSLEFSEKLEVAMAGVFAQPADAVGTQDPKSLTFTLTGAGMTMSDDTYLNLYQDKEAKEFRILSRSQLILEVDLSSYVDKEVKELAILFDSKITGLGKYPEVLATVLGDPNPKYSVPFKIQTSKTVRMEIKVQWKNIISVDTVTDPPTETLSPPSLILEIQKDD